MGRYLFISGSAAIVFYFAGLTCADAFAQVAGFLTANRNELLWGGLLGLLALIVASLLLNRIGFFNILYLLVKAVYELIQLFLCVVSMASLIVWFDLGINIWLEGGAPLVIVLYLWLYGSAYCLHIFDFNYPVRETLLSYTELSFVCLAVIWASSLIQITG